MFYNCNSLTQFLGNFNLSKVTILNNMFDGCKKLISLDLRNFNINQDANISQIFNNCNENLILCFQETIDEKIKNEIKNYTINCSCFDNSYKFFYNKNECIDVCSKDGELKYEYNNICIRSCPSETCHSPTNEFLCEDNHGQFDDECNKICNTIEFFNNNIKCSNHLTKDDMENNIREGIKNRNLDELIEKTLINEKDTLIVEKNNIKYEIATTISNNEYKNIRIFQLLN